jgi:hypothetical protein
LISIIQDSAGITKRTCFNVILDCEVQVYKIPVRPALNLNNKTSKTATSIGRSFLPVSIYQEI